MGLGVGGPTSWGGHYTSLPPPLAPGMGAGVVVTTAPTPTPRDHITPTQGVGVVAPGVGGPTLIVGHSPLIWAQIAIIWGKSAHFGLKLALFE